MSAAAWSGYRQLLLQARLDADSYRLMMRLSWLLAAGALLILAVTHYFDRPLVGRMVLVLFIWGSAQMWSGALLKSAMLQNRPEYAALVPHLRARLMRLVAVLFIGCTLLLGALAALLLDYPGYVLLCGGLVSVYPLFVSRYPMLLVLPSAIILLSLQFGLLGKMAHAIDASLGQVAATLIGSALLLALGAWGLQLGFPRSGDAHWAWFKRYNRRLMSLRAPTQNAPGSRVDEWWQALWRSRYVAALRRDSQQGGTPARMMVHALGPGAHPNGYSVFALVSTLVVIGLLAVLGVDQRANAEFVLLGTILAWSVLLSPMMYIIGATDGALRYQTEQAVFSLSAGAPAASQVNRLLGRVMLRDFLKVWLVTLLCIIAIDSFVLGHAGLRGATFVLWMLLLPMSCSLTRNYAVIRAGGRELDSLALLLPFMVMCIVLMLLTHLLPGMPWFWLGGAIGVVAVLVWRLRWQKLMALPPVLPAGRLAP